MIRVNLAGIPKKKAAKAAAKSGGPSNLLPIVHLLIIVGVAVGGYLWYSGLATQSASLDGQIKGKEDELKKLEAVIKLDQVFEARKAAYEDRVSKIDSLRKNQVSPLVMLDMLSDAIDKTHTVWLSTLSQTNTTLTMAGTGSSVDAIADLEGNMKATGFFKNINLQRFEDTRGNFNFSMTCEFAPPVVQPAAPEKGAN